MGKMAKNKIAKTMQLPEGSAPGCSQGGVRVGTRHGSNMESEHYQSRGVGDVHDRGLVIKWQYSPPQIIKIIFVY